MERAQEYRWSSAAARCGIGEDPLLEPMPTIPGDLDHWSGWLMEEENEILLKDIRRCTSSGRPYGSEEFVRGLEKHLGRKLLVQPGGRPRKGGQNPVQA